MREATERLRAFDRPAVVVWALRRSCSRPWSVLRPFWSALSHSSSYLSGTVVDPPEVTAPASVAQQMTPRVTPSRSGRRHLEIDQSLALTPIESGSADVS